MIRSLLTAISSRRPQKNSEKSLAIITTLWLDNDMSNSIITTCTFDQAAAIYGAAAAKVRAAAPGSRSAAIWMNRRDAISAAISARGLTIRPSIYGGYNVGRQADFQPIGGAR